MTSRSSGASKGGSAGERPRSSAAGRSIFRRDAGALDAAVVPPPATYRNRLAVSGTRTSARLSVAHTAAPPSWNNPPEERDEDDLSGHASDHADDSPLDEALEAEVQEALKSSPVVQGLQSLADAQRAAIQDVRDVSLDAQQRLRALASPSPVHGQDASDAQPAHAPSRVDDILDVSESAALRIRALQDELHRTEEQLQRAVAQIEQQTVAAHVPMTTPRARAPTKFRAGAPCRLIEFSSRKTSNMPGPLDRFVKRLSPTSGALAAHVEREVEQFRAPRMPSVPERRAPSRAKASASREVKHFHSYDKEERLAIEEADEVGPERRSPVEAGIRDRNGYLVENFVVDDDDKISITSTESTDDDSCSTAQEEVDSAESASEEDRRQAAIAAAYERSQAKCPPHEPLLRFSAKPADLSTLRVPAIRVKRRSSRSHIVDLLLNNWLRGNPADVEGIHLSEFLRQLRLLHPSYAISVFYVLLKRIRPLSNSLFKLLFRCVEEYLPSHMRAFAFAYRRVNRKSKTQEQDQGKAPKPTTRAPTIADITDIATAVGKFHNAYRAYARDHKGLRHRTIFQCLEPDQQSAFADLALTTEEAIEAMSNDEMMELWRLRHGIKSSAGMLARLRALKFPGDPMEPSIWAQFLRSFKLTLLQAATVHQPPAAEIARVFLFACPYIFLRNEVMSRKPRDLASAVQLVMHNLNDSGFLRSATSERLQASTMSKEGAPTARPHLPFPRRDTADGVVVHQRRDNTSADGGTRPQRAPETTGRDDRKPPSNPTRSVSFTSVAKCARCGRDGHTIDTCITKHRADGSLLPTQPPDEYKARKLAAVAAAKARLEAVAGIQQDSSSGTEDVEAEAWAQLQDDAKDHEVLDDYHDDDDAVLHVCDDNDHLTPHAAARPTTGIWPSAFIRHLAESRPLVLYDAVRSVASATGSQPHRLPTRMTRLGRAR